MHSKRQIFIAFGIAGAVIAGALYFSAGSRIPASSSSYAEPQVTVVPLNKKEIEEAGAKSEREIAENEAKRARDNRELVAQQAIERAKGEAGTATFPNMPAELLKKNPGINIIPSSGFLLTTSIRSRAGDRAVYGEISDCIGYQNLYDEKEAQKCPDWKYRVLVKDLHTGASSLLYSFPEEDIYDASAFIPRAHAGGCPLLYVPLAWSKNDKKIILTWGNPTSCGSGLSSSIYSYYLVSPEGGSIKKFVKRGGIFFDDYAKVVSADHNPLSLTACDQMGEENQGKIVVREVETGKETAVLSDRASYFEPRLVSEDGRTLRYSIRRVKEMPPREGGCAGELEDQGPTDELPIREVALPGA